MCLSVLRTAKEVEMIDKQMSEKNIALWSHLLVELQKLIFTFRLAQSKDKCIYTYKGPSSVIAELEEAQFHLEEMIESLHNYEDDYYDEEDLEEEMELDKMLSKTEEDKKITLGSRIASGFFYYWHTYVIDKIVRRK